MQTAVMAVNAGIDTWSVGWYIKPESVAEKQLLDLARAKVRRYNMLPEPVARHRVLFDRFNSLIMAEGHPDPDGLCPVAPDRLTEVQEAIADGLQEQGIEVPRRESPFDRARSVGFAGIRRLDLAVDAEKAGSVGRALLNGVAAVEPPGALRSTVHRSPVGRSVETVTWEGSAGKVSRVYDKGVESGSHPAGERVRFEDQRRFQSGIRPMPREVQPELAAMLFQRRYDRLKTATRGLIVTTMGKAVERVQTLVEAGEMTPATGLKTIGYLVAEREGVELGSRTSRWRHRQKAREVGLVLADGVLEEVEIDLAAEVDDVLEAEWS